MALATKFSVRDIQLMIHNSEYVDSRSDMCVPNVSWGLLPYEADLLVCRKSGVCMEFEIKRSFEDFKKDFTKDHKHDAFCISYFYYVIPEAIVKKALDLIREKIWLLYPAVLYYTEDGHLRRALDDDGKPFGNEKRRQARNLNHEEMATLGRLASLRLWNDRNEFSVTGFNRKEQEIKELKQINHRLDKNLRGLREQKFGMWFSASDVMPSDSREVLIYNYYHGVSIGWCNKGIWHTEKRDEVFVQSWCEIPAYRNILGGLDIQ